MKLDKIPTLEQIFTYCPGVRALLFDMDGTLFDSEGQHAVALHCTFKIMCQGDILKLSPDEIKHKYIGQSDPKVYEDIVRHQWLKGQITIQKFLDLKKAFLFEHLLQKKPKELLDPSMALLLEQISKRSLKVGLVSASEGETVHAYLKQAQLNSFFQIVLSRDDCARSKPDPMPYLMAMEKLSLSVHETVILEDSATGLAAANASGAHVIHARWFAADSN